MEHLGQPDNDAEARQRRMAAWQFVLPNVVETPLERTQMGRDTFLDGLEGEVVDLNRNVINLDDYRKPYGEAA
jgi:hypothetical protein